MIGDDPIPGDPQDPEHEGDLAVEERRQTKKPRRFKVLLHNDDYTTMEFVVDLLMKHFSKTNAEATFIMLMVHRKGVGVAGVYTRDVAETKVAEATRQARDEGHPLLITMEAE
ncbi:MAG: ATP-dependent Clp protease adapter ClpS [Deltaproteobacteria bacterium]|nr:ATP-dependent Clp protease adapter ClpS [Deltaproteobacteria bacterium]